VHTAAANIPGSDKERFTPSPSEIQVIKPEEASPASNPPRKVKSPFRLQQGNLPLEMVSKGRFEKTPPTIHRGEDLDLPTYVRRGIPLN
jgi:hypothetical protein